MNGFYLMHRGWMDHPQFAKEPYTEREAFEWLVSEAAWADGKIVPVKGKPVILERGQLSHALRFMADAWGWDFSRARRFLKKLENWHTITTENDTGQNIITICNYEQYQNPKSESETAYEGKPTTERNTERTNKKETKQLNKEEGVSSKRGSALENYFQEIGLPSDEIAPDEWFDWAKGEFNWLPPNEIIATLEAFRDWAKANANRAVGRKVDWLAAWRNWIRAETPKIKQRMQWEVRNGQKTIR